MSLYKIMPHDMPIMHNNQLLDANEALRLTYHRYTLTFHHVCCIDPHSAGVVTFSLAWKLEHYPHIVTRDEDVRLILEIWIIWCSSVEPENHVPNELQASRLRVAAAKSDQVHTRPSTALFLTSN